LFSINDLWKIYNVIQDDDSSDLNDSLIALAKSEHGKTNELFKNTIDLTCFNTNDYKRLRSFLTVWYASLKTITSTQSKVSDPFSLPDEHLNELFRSFGYHYADGINLPGATSKDKVNLFLDLVNLYKIKGTPRSIVEILSYYGLTEIDIFEYWLEKSTIDNLHFKGKIIIPGTIHTSDLSVSYENMILNDPHWFLNKSNILTSFDNNKINLPSKTPYFSIRPGYKVSYINSFMNIIARKARDQYEEYSLNSSISEKSILVTGYGSYVSLLEIYLSTIHISNQKYPSNGYSQLSFNCYDGTNFSDYIDIVSDYNERILTKPTSRINQKVLISEFEDLYSREKSSDFLINGDTAGTILNTIDSNFYDYLEYMYSEENDALLMSLLIDMSDWLRNIIGPNNFNTAYFIYGLSVFLFDIGDVINFFKPYHARLKFLELFEINYKLHDSVIPEDLFDIIAETETIVDWDTAAGDLLDSTSEEYNDYYDKDCPDGSNFNCCGYRRDFFDHESYYDIGACIDLEPEITITQEFEDDGLCISDGTGYSEWGFYNDIEFNGMDTTAILEYDSKPKIWTTGGFGDYDSEGYYDCIKGFDFCEIYVQNIDGFDYDLPFTVF